MIRLDNGFFVRNRNMTLKYIKYPVILWPSEIYHRVDWYINTSLPTLPAVGLALLNRPLSSTIRLQDSVSTDLAEGTKYFSLWWVILQCF